MTKTCGSCRHWGVGKVYWTQAAKEFNYRRRSCAKYFEDMLAIIDSSDSCWSYEDTGETQ